MFRFYFEMLTIESDSSRLNIYIYKKKMIFNLVFFCSLNKFSLRFDFQDIENLFIIYLKYVFENTMWSVKRIFVDVVEILIERQLNRSNCYLWYYISVIIFKINDNFFILLDFLVFFIIYINIFYDLRKIYNLYKIYIIYIWNLILY